MRMVGLVAVVFAVSLLPLFGADNQQPTEFKGTLQTGIMAIGGETTGTIIRGKGGNTYELDLGNLREVAEKLNGKEVVVQGALRVKPGVEITERRIITVKALRPADAQQDAPAVPKAEGGEGKDEKRELLANHETLAVFDGLKYRQCMGRTALCPDRCGHSGEFATFTIKKYLKYEKPRQYGDPEQKAFLVQVSDFNKKPKGVPKILETVKGLKKGDYVLLSWRHDYVTKEGASFPERPMVKLEAIGKERAKELLDAPAANNEKEAQDTARITGTFIVPKELGSFEGRVVEIQLFKIHPMIADKAADLVEKIEIPDFAHTKGTETKKEFVIGAKAKLEKDMKYYLTLFILKDGGRTHMGEVSPGAEPPKVLTQGQPSNVTLKVRQVR